jgi:thioredoxin 1
MQPIDVTSQNYQSVHELLDTGTPSVACLCASWCHVCEDFRQTFEASARHNKHCVFLWIDIEDEAALIDDLDIDDFPILMVEDVKGVRFYGSIEPKHSALTMIVNTNIQEINRPSNWTKEQYPQGIRQRLTTMLALATSRLR